jgi:predicted lipoprotein with Yx(FWY)xxD motif
MFVRRSFVAASVVLFALAACSSDNASSDTTSTPTTSPTTEPSETPSATPSAPSETPSSSGRSTEVESDNSPFGLILTDGDGNTLYAFQPDAQGASTCYDDCAANWPAFLAKGELEVSGNDKDPVDADLLDTIARDDGGKQVTYNGWPLYHFAGDQASGETNGQGVSGVWHVMSPDGDPITR